MDAVHPCAWCGEPAPGNRKYCCKECGRALRNKTRNDRIHNDPAYKEEYYARNRQYKRAKRQRKRIIEPPDKYFLCTYDPKKADKHNANLMQFVDPLTHRYKNP